MLDYRYTMDNFPNLHMPEDPRCDEDWEYRPAQNSNFLFLLAKLAPFIQFLKSVIAKGKGDARIYATQAKWLDSHSLNLTWNNDDPEGPAQNYSGQEYCIVGFTDSTHKEFAYRIPGWQDERPEVLRPNEGVQTRRYWTAQDLLALLEKQLRKRLTRCDQDFLNFLSEYIEK